MLWQSCYLLLLPIVFAVDSCSSKQDAIKCARNGQSCVDDFVEDTLKCSNITNAHHVENVKADQASYDADALRTCKNEWLRFSALPYVFFPDNSAMVPMPKINMSVVLFTRPKYVAFEITCVKAVSKNANLCHQHMRPPHWGGFFWPCRLFQLFEVNDSISTEEFNVAQAFVSHACFHFESYSVYRVNITLPPPHNCSSIYTSFMSDEMHVLPALAPIPALGEHDPNQPIYDWKPLVTVLEEPERSGAWLMFSREPKKLNVTMFEVSLYWTMTNELLRSFEVVPSQLSDYFERKQQHAPQRSASVFLGELSPGNYTLFVKIIHEKCSTMCRSLSLSFLYQSAFIPKWSTSEIVLLSTVISLFALTIVIILIVTAMQFIRCKISRRREDSTSVQLVMSQTRPKVLLLYTDDNEAYRNAVTSLARWLRDVANCDVFFDMWALDERSSDLQPIPWWLEALDSAKFVVIVASPGGRLATAGKHLKRASDRHYDNYYAAALAIILQNILGTCARALPDSTHNAQLIERYIYVTFDNDNDSLDSTLQSLPIRTWRLPSQCRQLFAHLHEVPIEQLHRNQHIDTCSFEEAVNQIQSFKYNNPDWYTELLARVVEETALDAPRLSFAADVPKGSTDMMETYETLRRLTIEQRYTLFPPQDDDMQGERYALVGEPPE